LTEHIPEIILNRLIQDCITYRLTDKESQSYVKQYTVVTLSEKYINKKKKEIESEPNITQWLNHHTRIGFIREHKTRMNEMEKIQEKLIHLFLSENDTKLLLLISERIESINRRLSELNLGSPIIAQIKKKLEVANTDSGENTHRVQNSPIITNT